MERTCSVCEDPLPLGSSHRRLYCGRGCLEKARWAEVKTDPARQAYARAKNRRAVQTYQAKHPRRVRWLAAQRKLAKAARGKPTTRPWYMGWCECGAPFVSQQDTTVVCSDVCRRRRSRKHSRAKHGRMDNHRKRARILGVEYEPIHRLKVFDRDGWRCGICGKRVDRCLPATHERGATLDHIVPMNAIDLGSHTYGNVQCAHRECNWRRGRTGAAQMLLVA